MIRRMSKVVSIAFGLALLLYAGGFVSANDKGSPPHGSLLPRLEEKDPDEFSSEKNWIRSLKTLNLTRRPLRDYQETFGKARVPVTTAQAPITRVENDNRVKALPEESIRINELIVDMEEVTRRTESRLYPIVKKPAIIMSYILSVMLAGPLNTFVWYMILDWPHAFWTSVLDCFLKHSPKWTLFLEGEERNYLVYSFYLIPETEGHVVRLSVDKGRQSFQRNYFAVFLPEYDTPEYNRARKLEAVVVLLVATSSLRGGNPVIRTSDVFIKMRIDLKNGFETYGRRVYAVPISIWPMHDGYEYIQDGIEQVVEAHLLADDRVFKDSHYDSISDARRHGISFLNWKELRDKKPLSEGIYIFPDLRKLNKLLRMYIYQSGKAWNIRNFKDFLEHLGIYIPKGKAGQGQAFNWLTTWRGKGKSRGKGEYKLHTKGDPRLRGDIESYLKRMIPDHEIPTHETPTRKISKRKISKRKTEKHETEKHEAPGSYDLYADLWQWH